MPNYAHSPDVMLFGSKWPGVMLYTAVKRQSSHAIGSRCTGNSGMKRVNRGNRESRWIMGSIYIGC